MEICLKTTALSKSFDSFAVLEDWNLEVKKGERLAIIGPSGCGKTTFLRIAAQLEKPTKGHLQVNSQKIGYVFQEPRLIPWKTVKDNLLFIGTNNTFTEILKKLELNDCEKYYPVELSGGMAQRVNLARALLAEPDLLLLDEAFFSLDFGIKQKIMGYLLSLWEKKQFTMIFVTHDIKDALLLSNRILILTQKPCRIKVEYHLAGINNPATTRFDVFKTESEIEQILID